MAKPSLIKLEFVSIPAQHFGAFWLFCEEHPGIQFKHQDPATSRLENPPKRTNGKTTEGSTGRCVVLRALHESKSQLAGPVLSRLLVEAGKAAKSFGGVSMTLRKLKHIKVIAPSGGVKAVRYVITAAGSEWFLKNCDC